MRFSLRIPGLKTIRQAACRFRSRFGDSALILGYHRVANPSSDAYGLCVRPEHFAEQLEVLRRRTRVTDLASLEKGLQERCLPRRAVVITFDDGYADNLHVAQPLLKKHDLPATVFVTTGSLGSEFWWDTLERLIFSPKKLPTRLTETIGGREINWSDHYDGRATAKNKDGTEPRKRLLHLLHDTLQALPLGEKTSALARVKAWVETASPPGPASARAMTATELQAMADGGLMTMGAHGVSHQPLTALPALLQKEQITSSKAMLTAIINQPVLDFSYPHGAASDLTRQLVREGGFQLACASHNDMVRTASNPLSLPRFWPSDWNGESFSRWLHRWLNA
jgi:peptidoglycan/xylan/chitin deacetylase (PgdA/CDA1 family)